ncbi:inner membrane protein of type IV secretion of T-DNA complex VirB6 [Vibrio astriarenae]|nr:inner membrane protein of type IV secretion of T-DNA complex VirB6 [Vibrio sp. C7]
MNTFQYTESVTISPFTFLGGTIENLVNKFLVTGAGNMMDWLSPIVLVGVALYFMMKGYEQLFGDSRELAPDVVKRCLIILCITALALNVDNYTDYVMEFINALGAELSAAVYSGEQTPVSVYQSLDSMLIKGIGQVSQALSRVGLTSPSTWDWIITAVVILVGMCGLTITAALIVIGTEFMLKILLVVGPLFLVAVCFPATRPHFDNWTKKIIEMVFIKMFALAVITLGLMR